MSYNNNSRQFYTVRRLQTAYADAHTDGHERPDHQHEYASIHERVDGMKRRERDSLYLAIHQISLEDAPRGYEMCKENEDGCGRCSRPDDRSNSPERERYPRDRADGHSQWERLLSELTNHRFELRTFRQPFEFAEC